MTADVIRVPDAGLGNSAWLVDLGDGRALAVDACRDLRALRASARQHGLRVAFAADTHLHADFLSGALQLHADDGATVLASRAGDREFPHRGLGDGDEVDLGGLRLRALATPGHTQEHVAFVLLDGDRELGVFSGGSLLAGSAARVDLVAPELTEGLAHAQLRSLRRLAGLPPEALLWPTHGGGSFCAAGAERAGASTIAAERRANPLLTAPDEDAALRLLVDRPGSYPPYFSWLPELNRRGPVVLSGLPVPQPLPAGLLPEGALVVDVRPSAGFAAGHPAGALSIPLREAFASWLGWLVDPATPVVVLRDDTQDLEEVAWQAAKIGYELLGEVAGGMAGWRAAGLPVASIPLVGPGEVGEARLLDVRQREEYDARHVPGAWHVELGALRRARVPDGPLVLMCGHGERAMSAASVLAGRGRHDLRVLDGDPDDVRA